jgi:hypothetical protein
MWRRTRHRSLSVSRIVYDTSTTQSANEAFRNDASTKDDSKAVRSIG